MFAEFLTKIFGSRNDRLVKQYRRQCDAINKFEPALQALSDEELSAKTQEFRDRLAKGETLEQLLPKLSPWCVKPVFVCWACVTLTCK